MKKIIISLMVIVGLFGCEYTEENEQKYEFKYGIETNESIITSVTYLYKGKYITEQIETVPTNISSLNVTQSYWESPPQTIQDDFYASIEIDDSHDQAGWFYFIVNNEIYSYSYISNNPYADMTWTFAWGIDLNNDGF